MQSVFIAFLHLVTLHLKGTQQGTRNSVTTTLPQPATYPWRTFLPWKMILPRTGRKRILPKPQAGPVLQMRRRWKAPDHEINSLWHSSLIGSISRLGKPWRGLWSIIAKKGGAAGSPDWQPRPREPSSAQRSLERGREQCNQPHWLSRAHQEDSVPL